MRADLDFTRAEIAWRRKHEPDLHPTLSRHLRRRLARVAHQARLGALPPGPHGFDVSSYQPAGPDFRAGGRTLAMFKGTEGLSYRDPHFGANRSAAHAEGCTAIGIYSFARPGSTDPVAAARYLLSLVGARQAYEFLILDFEVPPWSEAWAIAFIQTLQAAGWLVAFYSYAGMLAGNSTGQIAAATPFLWIAAYSSNPPGSDRWGHWTMWQHTDGQYGSVDGPWDCSVADPALLSQLVGAPIPPGPGPLPPGPISDLSRHKKKLRAQMLVND